MDCDATAPTSALANGATAPTATTFDATATPTSPVSGSRATIENVIPVPPLAGRAGYQILARAAAGSAIGEPSGMSYAAANSGVFESGPLTR